MITNPSFRIVANFSGDERPVTFQGNGIAIDGSPQGIVFDVPQDIVASEKNPIISYNFIRWYFSRWIADWSSFQSRGR